EATGFFGRLGAIHVKRRAPAPPDMSPSPSSFRRASSDRDSYGVVVQKPAVDGGLPLARGLQIAALLSRPELHVGAACLARSLIALERLLDRGGKRKGSAEHQGVFDGDAGTLAKEGGHRMRRVTEHRDPAFCPIRQGLAIA